MGDLDGGTRARAEITPRRGARHVSPPRLPYPQLHSTAQHSTAVLPMAPRAPGAFPLPVNPRAILLCCHGNCHGKNPSGTERCAGSPAVPEGDPGEPHRGAPRPRLSPAQRPSTGNLPAEPISLHYSSARSPALPLLSSDNSSFLCRQLARSRPAPGTGTAPGGEPRRRAAPRATHPSRVWGPAVARRPRHSGPSCCHHNAGLCHQQGPCPRHGDGAPKAPVATAGRRGAAGCWSLSSTRPPHPTGSCVPTLVPKGLGGPTLPPQARQREPPCKKRL